MMYRAAECSTRASRPLVRSGLRIAPRGPMQRAITTSPSVRNESSDPLGRSEQDSSPTSASESLTPTQEELQTAHGTEEPFQARSADGTRSSWANEVVFSARSTQRSDDTRRRELSRDMSASAESSKAARPSDGDTAGEDKEFAQLFETLRERWPKSSTSSSASPTPQPQSIASRLSFSPYDTPSPRRGVHARKSRSAGQTPSEAEAFNQILNGIFADLTPGHSPSASRLRGSSSPSTGIKDPYAAARGGGFGLGRSSAGGQANARGLRRYFEPAEDDSVEEYEMLAEEMEIIQNDVELLDWAKNRVFKPLPKDDPAAASLTSNTGPISSIRSKSQLPPMLTFAPTYPKILAHLLRTVRVNYNNPHLVLALFKHAQTSSLESYLSGCLTGAYNEMLTTRWESFKDLEGVENGVREMEMVGVNWDMTTARLVTKVVEQVSRDILPSSAAAVSSSSADGPAQGQGQGGFGNLAGLTGGGRYGPDVLDRLAKLDHKVQKDVRNQEKLFENLQRQKKRAREERERRLERERRAGAGENEHLPVDDQPSRGNRPFL
ncbi:hypothetical protein IAU60_003378 [Kwoniella sp. DSM 27419]